MIMKINGILIAIIIVLKVKGARIRGKVIYKLQENSGNWFEEAMKYIFAIVIGLLFLGGIYLLFKDTVILKIKEAVTNMFDFTT